MALTDTNIKVIQDFLAMMQKAQAEGSSAKDGYQVSSPEMSAYAAMLTISREDIAAFNARFPETPVGLSGI